VIGKYEWKLVRIVVDCFWIELVGYYRKAFKVSKL
jgi:hypothetical protein